MGELDWGIQYGIWMIVMMLFWDTDAGLYAGVCLVGCLLLE